jgi:hypothetical protein
MQESAEAEGTAAAGGWIEPDTREWENAPCDELSATLSALAQAPLAVAARADARLGAVGAVQPGMTPPEVEALLGPPMWSAENCDWTRCDDKPWPVGRTRWGYSNPDGPFRWHPSVAVYFLEGRVNEVRATRIDLWGVDHELVYLATRAGVIEPNDFVRTFTP